MTYIQQITAATNMMNVLIQGTIRYCLLVALCQAGKTGCYQYLITLMLSLGHVQRVYILCGSHEIILRNQAIADTIAANPNYANKIIVLFRQDFKKAKMNITNALIIVDESHLDQGKGQQLDVFLGRHGLNMDGNPTMLIEKNAYLISVDATPYSELAAITHNESPHKKHVEYLESGEGYYGLAEYIYNGLLKPTFNIDMRFAMLLNRFVKKYALVRLTNGKTPNANEAEICRIARSKGWKVLYYISGKDEIAITRAEQTGNIPCLEDEPDVNTLVIIRGRLRAGKVVPKEHIAFVWEGAKLSKTDSLVQGLPGRMCGYSFGETKPLIFTPNSFIERYENEVVQASESQRATIGHPIMIPRNATNLAKTTIVRRATNGKIQLPPLRLDMGSLDEYNSIAHTDSDIDRRIACLKLLRENINTIENCSNFTNAQKNEIKANVLNPNTQIQINNFHKDRNDDGTPNLHSGYFMEVAEAYNNNTSVSRHAGLCRPITFIVPHQNGQGLNNSALNRAGVNPRHFYVIFYSEPALGAAGIMTVNLESRISKTNGMSHFSKHDNYTVEPAVAGGMTGFGESSLESPQAFEIAMRNYLSHWRSATATGTLIVARCIETISGRFNMSKRLFNYISPQNNAVRTICSRLSAEFNIRLDIKFVRSSDDRFNVKKITW